MRRKLEVTVGLQSSAQPHKTRRFDPLPPRQARTPPPPKINKHTHTHIVHLSRGVGQAGARFIPKQTLILVRVESGDFAYLFWEVIYAHVLVVSVRITSAVTRTQPLPRTPVAKAPRRRF